MSTSGLNEFAIPIEVAEGEIRLGRNHAAAVHTDERIVWTCKECLFAVQFPPGSPFRVENLGHASSLTVAKEAQAHVPYKYTIAVHDDRNKRVLILDPVIIFIPPRG